MGFENKPGRTMPGVPSSSDEGRRRWPHLTLLVGALPGRMHRFREPVTALGRSMDCDVTFTDPGVSRIHARLERTESGEIELHDLGSTNGTWVNGEQIRSVVLNDGDKIRLGPTVVLRYNLQDAVDEAFQRSQFQAMTRDALTGAYNRAYFDEELARELSFARRAGGSLSVCMLDLDHFKQINDTWGHQAGDQVLVSVADKLTNMLREYDLLARVGGEEFAILMRATELEAAARVTERLRMGIEGLHVRINDGRSLSVTVSAGVASLSENLAANPTDLLHVADMRLYEAKRAGRNRVVSRGSDPEAYEQSTRPIPTMNQRQAIRKALSDTTEERLAEERIAARETYVGERSDVARLREGPNS